MTENTIPTSMVGERWMTLPASVLAVKVYFSLHRLQSNWSAASIIRSE